MKKNELIQKIENTTQIKIKDWSLKEDRFLGQTNLRKYEANFQDKGKFKSFVIIVENEGDISEKAYDIDGKDYDFLRLLDIKIEEIKSSETLFITAKIININFYEKYAELKGITLIEGKYIEKDFIAVFKNDEVSIKEKG